MRAALVLSAGWFAVASAFAQQHQITVGVVDADSGQPVAARLYLQATDKTPYFFRSLDEDGTAVRYEKQHRINKQSSEYHTTISAHRAAAEVPPGDYVLTIERGKSWIPVRRELTVRDSDLQLDPIPLQRWIDMASRGWYSGDLHLHRSLQELRTVVLAENLNVAFPLTSWVTRANTSPAAGDKNLQEALPEGLMRVTDQHVIWPRNTEYEIFSVGEKRHTLGALFVLGHSATLQQTVPPWQDVIESARRSDPHVIFDMDKLAWPFAMTLPVLAPGATYELANNHMWRTEFAFRDWYTPAPGFIQPPWGGTEGGERDWIDFTLGMYYTLLNAGFQLPPSAGTANGVHPVPAGFGRVYVQLDDGFDYDAWRAGLNKGQSFVTTGPMLFATANGQQPGHRFQFDPALAASRDAETFDSEIDQERTIEVRAEVVSRTPVSYGEIIVNGQPRHLLRLRQQPTEQGAFRGEINQTVTIDRSGWIAVRFFEDRPGGRVRFAHTAPWYVMVGDQPPKPTWEEKEYLVQRMRAEIQRSRGVVSSEALEEYEKVLRHYQSLEVADDSEFVDRHARPLAKHRQQWLDNMIIHHRFAPDEIRLATGMSIDAAKREIDQRRDQIESPAQEGSVRILPYPGGRHPRRGFLDGAIEPQRETKLSVFPSWEDAGYVVIDVPEAIFSNLGLTYLAHTHVPTIWSEQSIELEKREWQQTESGYRMQRKLPNGIEFTSEAEPTENGVRMRMSLTNGTDQMLSGMRSQVCVMLKGLIGFHTQQPRDTVQQDAFIAVRSDRDSRWVITAWQPNHRTWANPPVPCVHSDPIFPDCPPGETVRVSGGLWFYEGENVQREIERLAETLRSE